MAKSNILALFVAMVFTATPAQLTDAANFTVEVVVVHVDGSTSLPDPGPINRFLKVNTSFVNPLFPSHPPLQLQVCNSSLYRTAFNFYTAEHPGGCGKAPDMVRNANQDRIVRTFEKVCWIWNGVFFGLIILCLICWHLNSSFKDSLTKSRIWLEEALFGFDSCSKRAFGLAWMVVSNVGGVFLGVYLYCQNFGQLHLDPLKLPEPKILNQVLASSGQNVTLYLCTIRGAFQVYIGFAQSCDQHQVQDAFYPEVSAPTFPVMARGTGVGILTGIASMIMFMSALFFTGGLLHCCFFCWPNVLAKGCRWLKKRGKVYNVEMQAPPGSAV